MLVELRGGWLGFSFTITQCVPPLSLALSVSVSLCVSFSLVRAIFLIDDVNMYCGSATGGSSSYRAFKSRLTLRGT